jgi:hypothetical protein
MSDAKGYEGWAVIEIMGHQRCAGLVSEALIGGAPLLRVDIPSEPPLTQFYGGQAIFRLTPVSEEIARAAAKRWSVPEPVSRYEISLLAPKAEAEDAEVEEDDADDQGIPY